MAYEGVMFTFALLDGDLNLSSGDYEVVTGGSKLYQDLSFAVREPYGIDRFHPRWGSTLPSFIGDVTGSSETLVQNETRRVVRNYMAVQQDRIGRSAALGERSRYGTGEVVSEILSVQARAQYDSVDVRCVITTLSGAEIALVATARS